MKSIKFFVFMLIFYLILTNPVVAEMIDQQKPYDYQKLTSDLDLLKAVYGDVLTIERIGESYFGKAIWGIHLGKGKESIIIIGAHHGREWITSNLIMMMVEYYAKNYKNNMKDAGFDASILDQVSIWFIPMLNPDGVDIQQGKTNKKYDQQLVAMNDGKRDFTRWKANGVGIDLNRQYPAGWENLKSPNQPWYKFYKGKKPLEAKEVQALVQFVNKIKPQAAITYHSTGQEIFWRYGENQNIVRDYFIGEKISMLTGYPLNQPSDEATGGGFTDWFITEFNRPSFTIELCKPQIDRNPPISELPEEWERNKYVGLLLANEILNYVESNKFLK